jgi:hypothetical protein
MSAIAVFRSKPERPQMAHPYHLYEVEFVLTNELKTLYFRGAL